MAQDKDAEFLAGVIEGFYGKPWSQAERWTLFDRMAAWGLNTYLYAPKDDLKHRAIWRERYAEPEASTLKELILACAQRNLRFVYALSPGLDLRYHSAADRQCLQQRWGQMLELGCRHFALLFDDISDRLDPEVVRRWGSLAAAQVEVTHATFGWLRQRSPAGRFLFCPTPYCGRMAESRLGGDDYLITIGRELWPWIDVFWTGPEIVSREISAAHIGEIAARLRRKPLLWDNLHANDYDGRRFYCGPYAGRSPELRSLVSGLLSNPNNEFPLNYVPLRTLAAFVHGTGPWNARGAYLSAMREWHAQFATVGQPIALEDLILLGDSYYLPHETGPEAQALEDGLHDLLARDPAQWGDRAAAFRQRAARLRDVCARVAELRDRSLFYAMSRRVWELREELDLLDRYVQVPAAAGSCEAQCRSDFHLPDTYRGGLVARLQRCLIQQANGTFAPNPAAAREPDGLAYE
jgi:protein O-GlcNAcase/histone acetyltransferase